MTHLEILLAIPYNHIISRIHRTLLYPKSIPYCPRDELSTMGPREQEAGEDDGKVRIAHIMEYGATA